MSDLPATRVAEVWDSQEPGAFQITDLSGTPTLMYRCPCGCGDLRSVPVRRGPYERSAKAWGWDGDEDAPTLTPSIRHMDACRWHGFLTKGAWITCQDSGR